MADSGGARHLLTLGEAAELADVALLEMRSVIRSGQLPTRRGWHVGQEIDIILLEDLQRTFPSARGKRPSGPGLRARAIEVEGEDGAPTLENADPVTREIGHLREQVRAAKEQNRRLFSELGQTDTELRQLLERLNVDENARVEFERRMASGQRGIDDAIESLRRTRMWATAASVGFLVLLAVQLMGWAQPRTARAADESQTAAAPIDRSTVDVEPPAAPSVETRAEAPSGAPTGEINSGEADGEPGDEVSVEDSEVDGEVDGEEVRGDVVPPDPDDLVGAPAVELPRAPRATGPACSYFALTGRGQDLRDILGPCLGPWNEDSEVVVGAHRYEGAPYCQHHLVVPREFSGSLARARQVADLACAEELMPPLVQLRLDRAAAGFLKREVNTWIESGLEGGVPEEHAWTTDTDVDQYTLESWVRVAAEGDLARVRRFRLRLAIEDGPIGDRLLGFAWLE